jgi:MFS family permease
LPLRPLPISARPVSLVPEPFRIAAFRAYWVSRLLTTMAQMAMVVMIGWQVYGIARQTMGLKGAAFQLGLVGVVQFLPLFALTLLAGWTADRIDRRYVARAAIALEVFCAAALACLTWRNSITLPQLFGIAALLGVARAFAMPALQALAPNLVPREILPRAIALSSISWQVGAITGPAIGGYLYAIAPHLPYTVSAGILALALIAQFMIGPTVRSAVDRTRHPVKQMIDGLRYVRRNRIVLGAISLDLFAVLLGGATALLPAYARDVLHVGSQGLGHLRAAPAVGATLAAAWFSVRPLKHEVGIKMLLAVGVFGAGTIVFGLSTSMPLSLVCLALLGAADMFSVYVRQSLIQLSTPDEMRGRVGSVSSLFISASNELGEAESGFLGALIGPIAAVVAGGIGAIAVVFAWAWLFPELRRARDFDITPQAATESIG